MAKVIKTTFKLRRGLLEAWERNNPILAKGEPSFVLDKNALKIGDGVTPWKDLEYIGLSQEDLAQAIEDYFKENPDSGIGADGRGIVSITRASGDGAPGTIDVYTITYTDLTTSTFTVYNGKDGEDGVSFWPARFPIDWPFEEIGECEISGIQIPVSRELKEYDLILGTDGNTGIVRWIREGKVGIRRSQVSLKGQPGQDGRGITSILRTSGDGAPGSTDTYTINYDDNSTSTFMVYNGKDGKDGSIAEVEAYVAQQIANAEHLKRTIVEQLPDVSTAQVNTIYMIKKTSGGIASWGKNIYEEYMVIEGEWELIGNSQVDLTDYAKTDYVDNKTKDKADKATTLEGYGITDAFTKGETYSRTEISELIGQITGGESAADVLAKLNEYTGTNNERVSKVEGRVETLEKAGYQANVIEGIKLADATNALTLNNKIAIIPAAGASQYGLVKLSSEIEVNTAGALEVKALDLSKITQNEEDWLILDGGTSAI